jgi:hypothetical protein
MKDYIIMPASKSVLPVRGLLNMGHTSERVSVGQNIRPLQYVEEGGAAFREERWKRAGMLLTVLGKREPIITTLEYKYRQELATYPTFYNGHRTCSVLAVTYLSEVKIRSKTELL